MAHNKMVSSLSHHVGPLKYRTLNYTKSPCFTVEGGADKAFFVKASMIGELFTFDIKEDSYV